MIKFVQKQYSEYDAMRALYVELMKRQDRWKYEIIKPSELIPVLKGNSVVIERFVISHSPMSRDKYRMYLKIGAKAKLPDDVRLSGGYVYDKKLVDLSVSLKGGAKPRTFSNKKNKGGRGNGNNNNNNNTNFGLSSEIKVPSLSLSREVHELLGEALKYDKKDRSLVLEFKDIQNAIRALDILPFGISYKIYLLDA